jgi:hypothetical protein
MSTTVVNTNDGYNRCISLLHLLPAQQTKIPLLPLCITHFSNTYNTICQVHSATTLAMNSVKKYIKNNSMLQKIDVNPNYLFLGIQKCTAL